MDENRIFEKLDKIADHMAKIDKIEEHVSKQENNLTRLTVTVEEHVKRSNLQEENNKILRAEFELIKQQVNSMTGIYKFLGYLLIPLAALILGIVEFFKK